MGGKGEGREGKGREGKERGGEDPLDLLPPEKFPSYATGGWLKILSKTCHSGQKTKTTKKKTQ